MPSAATPADAVFRRVAVVGLGVMGGSFARAVSQRLRGVTVVGWSPETSERRAARAAGAVHEAPDGWEEAVRGADLVVLALPLGATCEMVRELPAHLHPEATVTELASVKAPVAQAVHAAGLGRRWVGSHPMVGSERSGFAASSEGLYEGAFVWTVSEPAAEDRRAALVSLWEALGATTDAIEAGPHDRAMALVSHLPQLTANALASALAAAGVAADRLGRGGRDMTRLAASNPAMWKDILTHSPPELLAGLRGLVAELETLVAHVETNDAEAIAALMERTRRWRDG